MDGKQTTANGDVVVVSIFQQLPPPPPLHSRGASSTVNGSTLVSPNGVTVTRRGIASGHSLQLFAAGRRAHALKWTASIFGGHQSNASIMKETSSALTASQLITGRYTTDARPAGPTEGRTPPHQSDARETRLARPCHGCAGACRHRCGIYKRCEQTTTGGWMDRHLR